jgi:succinate dehydrogenase/fumarate reductase flavoprotein subunit
VTLCSKSSPGRGSCSAISQGQFRASLGSFSPEEHKQLTLQAGKGLNDATKLDTLVANAASDVRRLQSFGVDLQERAKGYDSHPESIGREGMAITRPMAEQARSAGVTFRAPFFVHRLAVEEGRAVGVWGLEPGREEPSFIGARCIILATGGGSALFARTDNPQGMTGDGYALAFAAGLSLLDMEFVQFYPLCLAGSSRTSRLLPPLLGEAGRLENATGEDVVAKYGIRSSPVAIAARDELCQAMAREVEAGRGFPEGGLRLRMSRDDDHWRKAGDAFGLQSVEALRSWAEARLDSSGSLPVMPAAHFCMGGLATDEGCATSIEGLLAAGEVVGGLHGANRYGGNALTETTVFGRIAADEALLACEKLPPPDPSRASQPSLQLASGSGREKKACSDRRRRLQDLMWGYAGIIRSRDSLNAALEGISALRAELGADGPSFRSSISALELGNMLQVAEMIVRSALHREESRGSHCRIDHPQSREHMAKHISVSKQGEGMRLQWAE